MEFVNLETISTKIDYGLTESATDQDTGNKFLRITDIRQGKINWAEVPFCECSESDAKKYELQDGDIVFARTGSVGNTGLIRNDAPKGSVFASYLIRIRPNKELIDPEYLAYYFQTPEYWRQIDIGSVGAIQGGLNATKLSELKIPLPPLTEQKRIASLLARADRLRHLRRTAHDLGESLLQSVFLEMFGDPVENTKHWQCYELGEIANVERGRFSPRPRNDPKYYGGKYPFIQTGDISASGGIVTEYSQTLNELGIKVSKAFDVGTIVIAIVGATIGESAILGIKTYCPDSIIGITPNPKKCNSQYLNYVMRYWKPVFRAQAPETARANINIGIVKPIPVPVPPLSLQEEFAGVVARVESLRGRMSEGERQVEGLFESLLAEAFS
ncbi:MAG: restriction endonuclease subunit S [Chloroflexi bacterium]|nr:restriction endonuclease subunit S [Chloroflexota bacterium]